MRKLLLLLLLPLTLLGQKEVIIHLTTDAWPSETRWVLHADSLYGNILGDINYGYYTTASTTYTDTLYISDSLTDISFVIYDSYGDGMTSGSYYVSICGDTIVSYPNPSFTTGLVSNRIIPPCNGPPGPVGPCVPAILNINLDQFQSETTWEMHDSAGVLLYAGGPYSTAPDYQPQFENVCLPIGEVTLTMYDSYGDGLAGSLWGGNDGSYYLTQCGDTIVFGDVPNFGTDTSHVFISDTCIPPPLIPGCMDPNYVEYNHSATIDDSSCVTLKIYGCVDSTMFNYDSIANTMDYIDSCSYTLTLFDLAGNGWVGSSLEIYQADTASYNLTSGFSQTFTIQLKAPCPVSAKFFVNAQASGTAIECGFSLISSSGDTTLYVAGGFADPIAPFYNYTNTTYCGNDCIEKTYGCVDPTAYNYDSLANTSLPCYYIPGCTSPAYLTYYTQGFAADVDDGSCSTLALFGCTDSAAFNYDSLANIDNGGCLPVITGCMQPLAFNYNQYANVGDTCIAIVYGCMSQIALNYDSLANTDDGSCIGMVYGCTDTSSFNYSPSANIDDSSCVPIIYGCMNPLMFNYNILANTDNSSCIPFVYGCIDSTMFNYDPLANTNNNSCIHIVYGCTNPAALNYNPIANTDDLSCISTIYGCTDSTMFNYNPLANTDNGSCIAYVYGCTNPNALNYNPLANTDDLSCEATTYGCMDSTAFNYNPLANFDNGVCIPVVLGCTDPGALNYCDSCNTDDFSCITPIYGCMDSLAFNYNLLANVDNGSCVSIIYGCTDPTALNYCDSCNTNDFSCILPIYGCTDSTMFNFNPLANVNNNSCVPYIYGCTDPSALNYNASANTEDFSCISYIYGCTDSIALNYDPMANTDNGSCVVVVEGCMDQSAYNYNSVANVHDSISCLFDAGCVTGPGDPYWLNDPCYAWVIEVDEYCCANEWDEICQLTYNHCEGGWPMPTARILQERKLVKITDVLGRETKVSSKQVLFYIYDDGTIERHVIK